MIIFQAFSPDASPTISATCAFGSSVHCSHGVICALTTPPATSAAATTVKSALLLITSPSMRLPTAERRAWACHRASPLTQAGKTHLRGSVGGSAGPHFVTPRGLRPLRSVLPTVADRLGSRGRSLASPVPYPEAPAPSPYPLIP